VDASVNAQPAYGQWVRARRGLRNLSQRRLAEVSGVPQPTIAALETGRRAVGSVTRTKLDSALAMYPSRALELRWDQVVETFARHGQPAPQVFGSVARGQDEHDSDVDLLVRLRRPFGLVQLLDLTDELEHLLTFPVDIVDDYDYDDSPTLGRARAEAVAP
jgi:predicted nucleotidyltransferase